jgi:hypothetical protein
MDLESPELIKAMQDLRSRALSATPELDIQVTSALDPDYWQSLNSKMNVCGPEICETEETADLDPSVVERSLQMLSTLGYFQTPPIARNLSIEKMKSCLEVTQSAGWHPTFVFVYDEFWSAFRGPAMVRFLTGALGKNYGQLPYLWGHSVPANSKGWHPHVDGPSSLTKLTVWLALNDATLENGCMYVIPRNAETEKISDQFATLKSIGHDDARKLFQNVRALPAPAGSYLGWRPDLIHWGAKSGSLATTRLSISVEFAVRPSDPLEDKGKLMDAHPAVPLPSFNVRLQLIAKAIKNYEAFDPGVIRYLSLAEQILFRLKAGNSF